MELFGKLDAPMVIFLICFNQPVLSFHFSKKVPDFEETESTMTFLDIIDIVVEIDK